MKKDIRFAFHILVHPFDGFWDMKFEKKGRLPVAFGILALVIVSNIVTQKVTGFLFNPGKLQEMNAWDEILNVLVLFGLFCAANWSVTTLMDGKGRLPEILMTVGYACLPIPLIHIPLAIVSNIASFSEQAYLSALSALSMIWFFFLLFCGLMTIHQYSVLKMVVTLVITAAAIACIVFLYLLFLNLFSQMSAFVMMILKEIRYRT